MAVGYIVRTSHRTFRGRGLHRCRENGRLRCEAWASLWLSEVRQENAFTQRAVSPFLPDRLSAVFPAGAVPGIGGQRRSGAPRKSGPPSLACTCRCCAKAHPARSAAALVDVAGRALRRAWTARLPPTICGGASPDSNPAGGQAASSSTSCRPAGIIAGVGRIGSHATAGGDLHRCASRRLSYPRFSPSTRPRRNWQTQKLFQDLSSPL